MVSAEKAGKFASEWIDSWNRHDIDDILSHYANELRFSSPLVAMLKFNDSGIITSKQELARYFKVGLDAFPDLTFKLHNVFSGNNTVVLYYESVNNRMAAEVFELNDQGKAVNVFCNYSNEPSHY